MLASSIPPGRCSTRPWASRRSWARPPDTLISRSNLASWLGRAGRVQEAVGRFGRLLQDRTRVLGRDHPDTLATRGSLAYWEEVLNRHRSS